MIPPGAPIKNFMAKNKPNIIITGTPGVGKTSHCEVLCQHTGLKHLSINQIVKERGCQEEWDEELQSWIVDEDKVREPRIHEVPSRVNYCGSSSLIPLKMK